VAKLLKSTIDELLSDDLGGSNHKAPDIHLPEGLSMEDYATLAAGNALLMARAELAESELRHVIQTAEGPPKETKQV
jgi:hypothetical protein